MRTGATPRTSALGLAGAAVALEALGVLGFAVAEVTQIRRSALIAGVGTALLLLIYAVCLGAIARGLWLGRSWSRGPAVATQVLHLPIAWSFHGGSTWWVSLVLGLTAATVLACVFLPSSTATFTAGRTPASGPN